MVVGREEGRRLRLLLACCDTAVDLDWLAGSGVVKPSVLFALLEQGRTSGDVNVDMEGGRVFWVGEREGPILEASWEDVESLAEHPGALKLLRERAHRTGVERRFREAEVLYRHLVRLSPRLRAGFVGGEPEWAQVVLEATRLFRSAWLLEPEVLEEAIAIARQRGDLAAQAVLLASRGVRALSHDPANAGSFFSASHEAAEALATPAVMLEVRTYEAVALILSGRPGEGIAAFEALLGDGLADLLDPQSGMVMDLDAAAPASALSLLAHAYAVLGQYPRAVDLMQRVAQAGAERGNRALEAQGQVMLATTFLMAGEWELAQTWAKRAESWFEHVSGPYAFACGLCLAWGEVFVRPSESRRLLQRVLPGWIRTGRYWVAGSRTLELLARLEEALEVLDGISLQGEIERHLNVDQPLLAGIAHAWKGQMLGEEAAAARDAAKQRDAAAHVAKAVKLLREAGGGSELHRALRIAVEMGIAGELGLSDSERALAAQRFVDGRTCMPGSTSFREGQAGEGPEGEGGLEYGTGEWGQAGSTWLSLAQATLDLGRLGALSAPGPNLWGEVVARLCRELGAERCLLVRRDVDDQLHHLAARGGPVWAERTRSELQEGRYTSVSFAPAAKDAHDQGDGASGQRVVVPFGEPEAHAGFLAFENRFIRPRVGPKDSALLEMLGRQLTILLANVELWRELQETRQRLEQENRYYRETGALSEQASGRIVGDSAGMRQVLDLVRRVAASDTPVLVTGETGVGKEVISQEVHLQSSRRAGPFIAVHIASLSPGLVASALFGHERGAFTGATEQSRGRFELANGGTLFLDEIGELSGEDQIRLLRVLQEGVFERVGGTKPIRADFRLVAATNRDLESEVAAGRFREDLYYRLAAFPIHVPPLRQRREEIPTLALFFMEQTSRKLGVSFDGISESDMERLRQHTWPGNVRELQHVIERSALLSDPPRLRIAPLDGRPLRTSAASPGAPTRGGPGSVQSPTQPSGSGEAWVTLEEMERRYVRNVLQAVSGRISGPGGAAEILGMKPSTLHFWIDRLGLRSDLAASRKRTRNR